MKKTCKYCGVVDENHDCPYKHKRTDAKDRPSDIFRKSKAWTKMSKAIRQRDRHLCVVCYANRYNTIHQYNTNTLEVHHIVPINEDYSKRLDENNLVTLCKYHHKMAEDGLIPRDELRELIKGRNYEY